MDETSKKALIIIAVVAIIILLLYLFMSNKLSFGTPTTTPSPTPSSPSPTPSPTTTPSPSSPSPSPTPSSPIQVTSFVITDGCSGSYCWARVTFNSSITGTLMEVITVYSNGTIYCWYNNYQVNQGSNTIWLNDWGLCNHLGCNAPGQITALIFVIDGNQYTVPVTPTVGDPLSTGTPSTCSPQRFIGCSC